MAFSCACLLSSWRNENSKPNLIRDQTLPPKRQKSLQAVWKGYTFKLHFYCTTHCSWTHFTPLLCSECWEDCHRMEWGFVMCVRAIHYSLCIRICANSYLFRWCIVFLLACLQSVKISLCEVCYPSVSPAPGDNGTRQRLMYSPINRNGSSGNTELIWNL